MAPQPNLPKEGCSGNWLVIVLFCIMIGWLEGCRQSPWLAALQEFRLFGGCGVCCCFLLLLLFWPCWAPVSPSYFPVLVMTKLAEAHAGEPWVLEWESGKEGWQNEWARQQDIEGWVKTSKWEKRIKECRNLTTWNCSSFSSASYELWLVKSAGLYTVDHCGE